MKFVIFVTPRDFRDESLNMVKLFFDKWGVQYKVASYTTGSCIGSHGAAFEPDMNAGKIAVPDFDGIVLIDGEGVEGYRVYEYRPLLDLMLLFNNARKPIIAIGNAIRVPARANVINGKKVSVPNDAESQRLISLFHGIPSKEMAEMSENIITIGSSQGIETSMTRILEHIGVK